MHDSAVPLVQPQLADMPARCLCPALVDQQASFLPEKGTFSSSLILILKALHAVPDAQTFP